ncbi:MAG TPA: hypothetical protein VKG80_04250 [Trebonia sp.]|nr:hypothetical protein [Trebonia sp.]
MADPFAVRFAEAREKYGPLALGADPHGPLLARWGLSDDADGLERFTDILLAAADGTAGLINRFLPARRHPLDEPRRPRGPGGPLAAGPDPAALAGAAAALNAQFRAKL